MSRSAALKGYKGRDSISHRRYSFKTAVNRSKKTGNFTFRGTLRGGKVVYGLGHAAGENWAEKKDIDPNSRVRRYSKNSPSFDEGVWKYKQSKKQDSMAKALANKLN